MLTNRKWNLSIIGFSGYLDTNSSGYANLYVNTEHRQKVYRVGLAFSEDTR